jgi:hypothetical protein
MKTVLWSAGGMLLIHDFQYGQGRIKYALNFQ